MPVLAAVGDAVCSLYIRARLACGGSWRARSLHQAATRWTSAVGQAGLLPLLDGLLEPDERDIVRRGRNTKTGRGPKNVPVGVYRASTGLEALLGYLYLQGRTKRLETILEALWEAAPGGGGGDGEG
ncbi:MAG: ribonuclease III domain-containing protein [bacterium]|nr:ribonuclease III domain-containing protein [bacterium]